jgi:hypothetical protein
MPQVKFEPTIPVFERAKTVHDLDHAATVITDQQLFSSSHLSLGLPNYKLSCAIF